MSTTLHEILREDLFYSRTDTGYEQTNATQETFWGQDLPNDFWASETHEVSYSYTGKRRNPLYEPAIVAHKNSLWYAKLVAVAQDKAATSLYAYSGVMIIVSDKGVHSEWHGNSNPFIDAPSEYWEWGLFIPSNPAYWA